MGKGMRYTMNHLGDIVVEGVEKIWGATCWLTMRCFRNNYAKERQNITLALGQRIREIRQTSPDLEIFDDDILRDLFARLSEIEKKIEEQSDKRGKRDSKDSEMNETFA